MSKERLEEIETQLNRFMTPANKMVLLRDDAEWLIKYAKEQAERVQELEKDRENMKELIMERHGTVGKWIDKCGNLEQQNKRYRELLDSVLELQLYINYSEAELYKEVLKIMENYLALESGSDE